MNAAEIEGLLKRLDRVISGHDFWPSDEGWLELVGEAATALRAVAAKEARAWGEWSNADHFKRQAEAEVERLRSVLRVIRYDQQTLTGNLRQRTIASIDRALSTESPGPNNWLQQHKDIATKPLHAEIERLRLALHNALDGFQEITYRYASDPATVRIIAEERSANIDRALSPDSQNEAPVYTHGPGCPCPDNECGGQNEAPRDSEPEEPMCRCGCGIPASITGATRETDSGAVGAGARRTEAEQIVRDLVADTIIGHRGPGTQRIAVNRIMALSAPRVEAPADAVKVPANRGVEMFYPWFTELLRAGRVHLNEFNRIDIYGPWQRFNDECARFRSNVELGIDFPGTTLFDALHDMLATFAAALYTAAALSGTQRAEPGDEPVKEALRWLLHLHCGISKDGSYNVTDEEWKAAITAGMNAMDARATEVKP